MITNTKLWKEIPHQLGDKLVLAPSPVIKTIVNCFVICYIMPREACHTFRGHLAKGGCQLWAM